MLNETHRAPPRYKISDFFSSLLRDKVPIFTVEMLDADSKYPTMGKIPCEVLETFKDSTGRELVRVSTEKPCGIDSAEGLSEFIVFPGIITEDF
jgi:hypothetical protein